MDPKNPKNKTSKTRILHPFLLILSPILSLYAANAHQLSLGIIIRPSIILLGIIAILYAGLSRVIKNRYKVALLLSISIIMIFSWLGFYRSIMKILHINIILFTYLWFLLFIICIILILVIKLNLRVITGILNITSMILILLIIIPLGISEITFNRIHIPEAGNPLKGLETRRGAISPEELPDIYYIILDGYGGQNVLKKYFHFDNSHFTDYLKKKGFYVADEARSNYTQTLFSLASSMNMRYLTPLVRQMDSGSKNRKPLMKMINNSALIQYLSKNGYHITTLPSGYVGTEMRGHASFQGRGHFLTQFEYYLINSTILQFIFKKSIYFNHVNRIHFTLNKIGSHKSPNFSFVHILCPHPPFVFQPDGNVILPESPMHYFDANHLVISQDKFNYYLSGYPKQVAFINNQIKKVIERLIGRTQRPLIILIQGDHGPGLHYNHDQIKIDTIDERFSILNAYFFSDGKYDGLYPSISPVNSFRVIMNKIFQLNLKPLDDRYFFVPWSTPFKLVEIPDQ